MKVYEVGESNIPIRKQSMTHTRRFFYIGMILIYSTTLGQTSEKDSLFFFKLVDIAPEPVGGIKAVYTWFSENLDNHKFDRLDTICEISDGRVMVMFIINEDGNLERPEIAKGISEPYDKYCLDLVSRIPISWIPGTHNGEPVKVLQTYPFSFCSNRQDQASKENRKKDSGLFKKNRGN